ncbi:YdcF family protein [Williamsia soli]|uniref:YdcF family protein n=1 Tax=Williamsia soli TaxID=364929 RepID=UPI001A9E51D3|nr:YdcF family protein [Williamsia soli]
MTRVNRTLVAAAAAIGMSTGAVALIPTVMNPASSAVVPTVSEADLTAMFNAAQDEFGRGNATAGLSKLRTLLAANPRDTDALALQALWSDYCADRNATQSALTSLDALDRTLAQRVRNSISAIDAGVRIGPDPVPRYYPQTTGIVVLGAGLRPDGAPTDETASRLFAAWTQAIVAYQSPIIISAGGSHHGRTEATVMRDWLVAHALPATRIHLETRAQSLPQHAALAADAVRGLRVREVVLVTSPDEIRRAASDFLIAGVPVVAATTSTRNLVTNAAPPSKVNQKSFYQDAAQVVGIPAERGTGVAPRAFIAPAA